MLVIGACPGLDFAYCEMKLLLFAVYARHRTQLADDNSHNYVAPFAIRRGLQKLNALFEPVERTKLFYDQPAKQDDGTLFSSYPGTTIIN